MNNPVNFIVLGIVLTAMAYGYLGYANAPAKDQLNKFFNEDVSLACLDSTSDDVLVVTLRAPAGKQSFEVARCNINPAQASHNVMASEHNGQLWELHIDGFQKVRYERTRVRPILYSFFILYFIVPVILIQSVLTKPEQNKPFNVKDAIASVMTGAGSSVLILMVFESSYSSTLFSSITGPFVSIGVYSILRRVRGRHTSQYPS